jgi:hypothetical protein
MPVRRIASLAAAAALAVGAVSFTAPAPVMAGPLQAQLSRTLPEVRLDGVALGDALDFIRDVSGVNMSVEWKTLEAAGVTRDTPINVRLRGVSLRKALNTIMAEAGGGDQIGWTTDEGVVTVTTKEKINATTYTRIYDIRDLLVEIPDFKDAPNFSLQSTSTRGGGASGSGAGGAGGGQGLFGSGNDSKPDEVTKTKDERAEELLTLIKETISPDIWSDNGGIATIRYFNGSIVVRAPKYVHEAIGGAWD